MWTLTNVASFVCFTVGAVFWLWGSAPLLRPPQQRDSILFNLHTLSVSDTLGSMSIIVGLLFQLSREWPLLLLALFSLAIWNTVLSYVLAYCYYTGRDVADKYGLGTNGAANRAALNVWGQINSQNVDSQNADNQNANNQNANNKNIGGHHA